MTSFESNDSNAVEADGIGMSISDPKLIVLPIPENTSTANTPVKLSIGISNNTPTPVPFCVYNGTLLPELIGPSGQVLERLEPKQMQLWTGESYCDLVEPGWSIGVSLNARLSWRNNLLQLEVSTNPDDFQVAITPDTWTIAGLQPGTYQLRFTYRSPMGEFLCVDPTTLQERRVELSSIGQLTTQFVNLRLVQLGEPDSSVLEVDGIRFETLVPQRVLTVPKNQTNANTPVQFGIRVTNLSPTPYRFKFFDLMPEILGSDGQVIQRGAAANLLILPKESDFLLAMPGESVSFFVDGKLYWYKRELLLTGDQSSGGVWTFHNFKPGTYRVRFTYQNKSPVGKIYQGREMRFKELFRNVWTGMVSTPFVSFRLQPGSVATR